MASSEVKAGAAPTSVAAAPAAPSEPAPEQLLQWFRETAVAMKWLRLNDIFTAPSNAVFSQFLEKFVPTRVTSISDKRRC
jgi:hypothetical protein